ncbi:LOW QUALITY PROTEIN: hypothetical protein ACHAWF_002696 [Thalassiosira exigua]
MKTLEAFMTTHKTKTTFDDLINPYLLQLQELRLSWCHIQTMPKTKWICDDELGFCRISLFAYGLYFRHIKIPENMNTTDESVIALQQMLSDMYAMIALLMSPREQSNRSIDRFIKFFLSCCHRFDLSYYESADLSMWSNTGKFPSLLNITLQNVTFGPLRWYWEGTRERFIQTVKKVLVSMRKTATYFVKKLILMQKLNVMEWLKEALRVDEDEVSSGGYERMYYKYCSLNEVEQKFNMGTVMSAFTMKGFDDHVFFCRADKADEMTVYGVDLESFDDRRESCGLWFGKCAFENVEAAKGSRIAMQKLMVDYCLLLPYVEKEGSTFKKYYAIVYSDWDVRVGRMRSGKQLPSHSRKLFDRDVLP